MTTPGILAYAIKTHGWSFLPNQVLPPLLANVSVGAVLYAAYLTNLGLLYEPASHSSKRIYPPPPFHTTFFAGYSAGVVQSLLAAPLVLSNCVGCEMFLLRLSQCEVTVSTQGYELRANKDYSEFTIKACSLHMMANTMYRSWR